MQPSKNVTFDFLFEGEKNKIGNTFIFPSPGINTRRNRQTISIFSWEIICASIRVEFSCAFCTFYIIFQKQKNIMPSVLGCGSIDLSDFFLKNEIQCVELRRWNMRKDSIKKNKEPFCRPNNQPQKTSSENQDSFGGGFEGIRCALKYTHCIKNCITTLYALTWVTPKQAGTEKKPTT